jgi:hypothetical protein
MSDLFPKFIIETDDELGDCLILSRCSFHKDLAIDITKVKGGGFWVLKDNMFIFSGESHDFGRAKFEDIQNSVLKGNVYTNPYMTHSIVDKHNFGYDTGTEIITILPQK